MPAAGIACFICGLFVLLIPNHDPNEKTPAFFPPARRLPVAGRSATPVRKDRRAASRRAVVGRLRRPGKPDALSGGARRTGSRANQLQQPVRAAAALVRRPLRLVRTPLPIPDRAGTAPPLLRPRGTRGRARRRESPRRLCGRLGGPLPALGNDSRRAVLLHAAIQHLDRAHVRPEPARHHALCPQGCRKRLPAGNLHDRRQLAERLRELRLQGLALPRSAGHDRLAARHGIPRDALDLPLRLARLARIPRTGAEGLPAQNPPGARRSSGGGTDTAPATT